MLPRLKALLRAGIERAVHAHGYRLVKPANRYGLDVIADVTRLAGLWGIDMELVFDVGANVGARTLAFRAAWPACSVVAFEPNDAIMGQLRSNVEAVGGIRIEPLALSARTGRSDFFVYEDASVLGSLNAAMPYAERFGFRSQIVNVNVTTLDRYCHDRSIERINLLKIDAEGSDHDVLRGSHDMIADGRIDFVSCEFNSLAPETGAIGSLIPIAMSLGEHGYSFIASYNDYILTEGRLFSVSNALFAADRKRS